jgi:hypothetical protein
VQRRHQLGDALPVGAAAPHAMNENDGVTHINTRKVS